MTGETLTLFPETQFEVAQRIDAVILPLLLGYAGGALNIQLDEGEKQVLRCIRYCRGLANAVPLARIADRTGLDARTIKGIVRTLRLNFLLPIGSSKSSKTGGYYLIISAEDRATWVNDALNQIRSELAVLRAAAGHKAELEILGQLRDDVLAGEGECRG